MPCRSLPIARSLLPLGSSCDAVLLGVFYSAVKAFQCGGRAGRLIASFVVPPVRYFDSAGQSFFVILFCSVLLGSVVFRFGSRRFFPLVSLAVRRRSVSG